MKVLIAEDDPTTRVLLESHLRKWGYEPIITGDGIEALERLSGDGRPPLAILDWMMPRLEGTDICRRARNGRGSGVLYIILLTAKGKTSDIVTGLEAGADDYIAKPFDHEELRARVKAGRRIVELQSTLAARIDQLQGALAHIKTLQGILPVCSHCRRIRSDRESWERIEQYIVNHSDARLSHTLCPDCIEKHYPDYAARRRERLAGGNRRTR
ncbi:MAG: response regulator [Chitinivibrionales bacterium]|nr:response regulator [Chitinivibrionales bacterium]MBD3357601.1 response regulator [Chitinivibrionales bacterium]